MPDPLDALDLVDLLTQPRQLRRWVVAQVAQVGFTIVAIPIGCAVFLLVLALGLGLAGVALLALDLDASLTGLLGVLVLGASVAITFIVLVRLYRAMPRKIRAAIEMTDEDGPKPDAGSAPKVRRGTTAKELAALDARLGPPKDPRGDHSG